jgi:hypothetical protein
VYLLAHIREVLGSNLVRNTVYSEGFRGFLKLIQEKAGIVPRLSQTASFQILSNSSSICHPAIRTLYVRDTDTIGKCAVKMTSAPAKHFDPKLD